MFFGGLLMLGARLGDRYGHRLTILVSRPYSPRGRVAGAAPSILALHGRALRAGGRGRSLGALRAPLLNHAHSEGPARHRAIAAWSAAGAAQAASGFGGRDRHRT